MDFYKDSISCNIYNIFNRYSGAYIMANYKGRWRGLIDGLFTLPLILPPTVIGFFLITYYVEKMDL